MSFIVEVNEIYLQINELKALADNIAKGANSEILNAETNAHDASVSADNASIIESHIENIAKNIHTLTADTGVAGSMVVYDEVLNKLTVPRGVAGANGVDGLTPVYEFSIDGTELVMSLTTHIPSTQATEGEW